MSVRVDLDATLAFRLVSGTLDFGILGDLDADGVYPTGTLGYRYERPGGGLEVFGDCSAGHTCYCYL